MINQLIEANLSRGNPMPYLVGVERMLRELYHTWKTAESRHKAASSSSGHSRPEDSSIEAFSATG
jgi:flagellin-specific chaperone FliS